MRSFCTFLGLTVLAATVPGCFSLRPGSDGGLDGGDAAIVPLPDAPADSPSMDARPDVALDVAADISRPDAVADSAPDAVPDAVADVVVDVVTDSAPMCAPGLTMCSECVDTSSSPTNCGACGNACGAGDVCAAGMCARPRLNRVVPEIAQPGQDVVLEGAFGTMGATVAFPGAAMPVIATVLGTGRLRATVPADAKAGDLTVTVGGTATNAVRFRRTSFSLGLQHFRARYEQTDFARQTPSLTTARVDAASLVVPGTNSDWLYVFGGSDGAASGRSSIERAMINDDGTLGAFNALTPTLTRARAGARAVRVGRYVYVLGGDRSVERATLGADGSLSAFADAGVSLTVARSNMALVVIGPWLYAFGGGSANVERAAIRADDSLAAFEAVRVGATAITTVDRSRGAALVVGDRVYFFGGRSGGTALDTTEFARIDGAGNLVLAAGRAFEAGPTMRSRRDGVAALQLGGQVFLVGGDGGMPATASIERAGIQADNSLGAFAVHETQLSAARAGAVVATVGNYVYLVGGTAGASASMGLDRAQIVSTGTALVMPTSGPTFSEACYQQGPNSGAVVIGHYWYLFGCMPPSFRSDARFIMRVPINVDGSLGAGTRYASGGPLYYATGAIVGNRLLYCGGQNVEGSGQPYSGRCERRLIDDQADLSMIDAFDNPSDITGHARSVVLGSTLVTLGGAISYPAWAPFVRTVTVSANADLSNYRAGMLGVANLTAMNRTPVIVTNSGVLIASHTTTAAATVLFDAANMYDRATTNGSFAVANQILGVRGGAIVGGHYYQFGSYQVSPAVYQGHIWRAPLGASDFTGAFEQVATSAIHPAGVSSPVVIGNAVVVYAQRSDGDTAPLQLFGLR